jgi:FAD/FMN-containing dehydrogenase
MAMDGAVEIDLGAMNGIVSYDPESLTVTVGAALTVGELRRALAEHRQTVGPWRWAEDDLTAGMLAATAWPTPGMTMYGAARDVVVGLRVVTAGGHDLRLGSSCVKNSSGYALERLFVGGYASLGIIGEVSLRTHPQPEAERKLSLTADRLAMERLVRALVTSPAPIEYARAWPTEGAWRIEVGVCGWEAEVEAAAKLILRMAEKAEAVESAAVAEHPTRGAWVSFETMAAVKEVLAAGQGVVEYWPMAGLVFGRGEPATVEHLYVGDGPEVAIARRIKALMDPKGTLPPW